MRIVASPAAEDHIARRGGQLWVWVQPRRCCGGPAFLEAATDPPQHLRRGVPTRFDRVEGGAFVVHLAHGNLAVPDELHVELHGRRRPQIHAYWNGCAYVGLV